MEKNNMSNNSKIKLNMDSLKSRREWKRHKVKDGHNVFRILPPFGEASNGYPYRKWQIIWGLTDPESGRARPFASSMTSEKRCPVTEYVNELKKRADEIEAKLKASGADKDAVTDRLKDLRELINDLSPKTIYIYNAADKAGEVGLLELKSTAHKDMKTKMNQYIQDYNQDPTSLNSADDDSGVWFDITRQGLGRDTEYAVNKCQTRVKNGAALSFVDDRSALPDSVIENYDNLAYDLTSVYQIKTFDELSDILAANMDGIVQMVPEANLSAAIDLNGNSTVKSTTAAQTTTNSKPVSTGTKTIALNLDDSEDDLPVETQVARPTTTAQTAKKPVSTLASGDDFMAEADAILNG
jgi:hypothetical protein